MSSMRYSMKKGRCMSCRTSWVFSRSSSACMALSIGSSLWAAFAKFVTVNVLNRAPAQRIEEIADFICDLFRNMLVAPLSVGDRRRRQNWRSRCSLRLPLRFDLADQHGGGDCADRNATGFGTADSVEDILLIAGCDDAVERGLRGADDAYAADELIGAAIDVDAIDDQRDDLEGLWRAAGGYSEA